MSNIVPMNFKASYDIIDDEMYEKLGKELIEEIWTDAFKDNKGFKKNQVKDTFQMFNSAPRELSKIDNINNKYSNKIRHINDNGFVMTNCKTCGIEFKISTNYTGNYPLCDSHRDHNNRLNFQKKKV